MPSQPPEPLDEPMQDAPTSGIAEPAAQETVIAEIDDKQCIRTVGTRCSPALITLIETTAGRPYKSHSSDISI